MAKPWSIRLDIKTLLLGVVAILVLTGLFKVSGAYLAKVRVPPEERLGIALEKTLNSKSFRFNMVVKVAGKVISDVEGERVAPESVHVKGTMQKLPVELIHTGDQTFVKGYWSDNWTSLEGNQMAESELFVTEFNPLGNFNFKDIPLIKEVKDKTKEGREAKLKVLEFKPIVENQLMELNYEDFNYRVWIDPKQQVISKAIIQATGKNHNRNQIEITLKLWDYNKPLTIEPPRA